MHEIREGLLKRIHVNQHHIKANLSNVEQLPVVTVKTSNDNIYGNDVKIEGPSRVIYSPEKPLPCGAKVWIETDSKVTVM